MAKIPEAIKTSECYEALESVIAVAYHASGDDETALADVLADLMYWADEHGVSFDVALERGEAYYGDGM